MDLSIKDLIMKTERPVNGLRALAPQLSLNGVAPSANAAFNDLLNSFHADRSDIPAADRSRNEPTVRTEPESRRQSNGSRADETGAREAAPDAKVATERTPVEADGDKNTVAISDNVENTESSTAPITVAGDDSAGTMGNGFGPATPEPTQSFTSNGTTTLTNTVLAAAPAVANAAAKADLGVSASLNAAPNANLNVKTDVTQNTDTKQPAGLFRDLAPLINAAGTPDLGDEALTQLAAALNKPAAKPGATGTTATDTTAAAPGAILRQVSADALPRMGEGLANVTFETDTLEVAPLRQPVTPGLLALQEVGSNTQAAAAAGNTPNATAQATANPGQATTPGTAAPAPAPADMQALLAGITAPRMDAEASTTTFRTAGPAAQTIIGGPVSQTAGLNNINQGTATPQALRTPPAPPVAIDDVAVHIARAAAKGVDHINIKLKPAALGEVEVKLELTHDGRVAAVVTADRADTLEMLARDAKSLERALAEAGLKTDQGSLQFNLRGDGNSAHDNSPDGGAEPHVAAKTADISAKDINDGAIAGYANSRAALGGVDIRV